MLKRILLVLTAITVSTLVFAGNPEHHNKQKPKWSIHFSAGTPSTFSTDNFLGYGPAFGHYDDYYPADKTLSEYYGAYHGKTYSSGYYSIGAEYPLLRWLSISADLGFDVIWHKIYNGETNRQTGIRRGASISFIPQAKFLFLNRETVRLYGYLGVGVITYLGHDLSENEATTISGQYTPLGIEVGKRISGFAEFGYGAMFSGVRIGVSYKF